MNKALALWLASLQKNAEPNMADMVLLLGPVLPALYALKDTEQDPEWHGEGNVHIHTAMVLEELYVLLNSRAVHIQGPRRQALILGALLHDIAKPVCTRRREVRGTERVVASHHEDQGRSYLAYKLMGIGLSHEVVLQVLGLVGEHHMPKLLVVRDQPQGDYLGLARRADCELLYWLEVADMSGRFCPDKPQQLEYLELFRLYCLEYAIWHDGDEPWRQWRASINQALADHPQNTRDLVFSCAVRDREAGLISLPEEAIAKSYRYRASFPQLVILCGPSGAGKSHYIEKHLPGYQVVSLDAIREELCGDRTNQKLRGQVLHAAKDRLKHHLRSHHAVVWDATNLRKDFRHQLIDIGYAYDALITMVIFHKPEEAFRRGNRKRQHAVPDAVLEKQLATMQWPTLGEVCALKWVVEGGLEAQS